MTTISGITVRAGATLLLLVLDALARMYRCHCPVRDRFKALPKMNILDITT